MSLLIADSGSTKTDWRFADESGRLHQFHTEGYNPYYVAETYISASLRENLLPALEQLGEPVRQVFFYGAGCANSEKNALMRETLAGVFGAAEIDVQSDMLGAARALCGRREGIAAILGTGSNSCYYDGAQIVENRPSLGYTLGDEGSGADIGKQLVRAFLYGNLPAALTERFEKRFALDRAAILEKVYRQPFPNRFLASFSKFVYQNLNEQMMTDLVVSSFRAFFDTHICRYEKAKQVQLHCTGSVGFYFSNLLRRVAEEKGIALGTVTESPIAGLALYHLGE